MSDLTVAWHLQVGLGRRNGSCGGSVFNVYIRGVADKHIQPMRFPLGHGDVERFFISIEIDPGNADSFVIFGHPHIQ